MSPRPGPGLFVLGPQPIKPERLTKPLTLLEPALTPPVLPSDSVNTGNNTLKMATEAEGAGDYNRAFMLVNEAIEQGVSADWTDGQAFAYNMRGTYKWVSGLVSTCFETRTVFAHPAFPFSVPFLLQVRARRRGRRQGRL